MGVRLLVNPKLEWTDEYFAASVSEAMLPRVRGYIANQALHHKKKSFGQEWDEFSAWYLQSTDDRG